MNPTLIQVSHAIEIGMEILSDIKEFNVDMEEITFKIKDLDQNGKKQYETAISLCERALLCNLENQLDIADPYFVIGQREWEIHFCFDKMPRVLQGLFSKWIKQTENILRDYPAGLTNQIQNFIQSDIDEKFKVNNIEEKEQKESQNRIVSMIQNEIQVIFDDFADKIAVLVDLKIQRKLKYDLLSL